ncbi:NAD(P)-dependent oxidoreductase [Colwellia sp. 75C3]|uniref:NAD(P)-dependent oxidoreductase n=1 Tax=Colwellia sp. 75C3 TaxID=888425 RepID=UPI000C339B51|nr:NAD(P)-dependent oxidoreductase [Colwellia sp. 75C3]PKG86172.1 NAD(P)-dependent oxidoreductase [Colwellia sp. 75C3]
MTIKVVKNEGITSVGIVGCGWLGSALANQLKKQGVAVLATRSNIENAALLKSQDINAEVLCLPTEQALLNSHPIFKQQCLVIAITPQFRQGRVDYADKVKQLVESAKVGNCVEQIILLSSSAIYNGLSGQVDEHIELDFSADKVSVLNDAEQAVLSFNDSIFNENSTNESDDSVANRKAYVLRLSGLVGPNRHPGKFLLNGRMLKSPLAIVNLIHQQDAVGLIQALLESDIRGGIFNGVSSTQVSKKQYYQTAASALQLPTPTFEETNLASENAPKIVSAIKTRAELNYSFVYDDLLQWLEQGE